jgi:hypothetical protein
MKHCDPRQRAWWALRDFHDKAKDKRRDERRAPAGVHKPGGSDGD